MTLEVMKCPAHGFYCVVVNGRRITSGKCCGSWVSVRKWKMTKREFLAEVTKAFKGD